MPVFLSLSLIDWIVLILAVGIILKAPISNAAAKIMAGKPDKHQLHSEIHGILMACTAQAAAANQIRDSLSHLASMMGNPDEYMDMRAKQLDVLQHILREVDRVRSSGLAIGEVNSRIMTEQTDTMKFVQGILHGICGPIGHDGISRFSKMESSLYQINAALQKPADDSNAKFHETVLSLSHAQLDATKKLDDRLFEFVNSTKRIMRAIEGTPGGDDDALIEAARDIRVRAAEKDIDMTLEECIKRAREQANFR